jgi:hypothetical protein
MSEFAQILQELKQVSARLADLEAKVIPAAGALETNEAIAYMGWSHDTGKRLLTWLRTNGHIKLSAKTRPMRYEVRELNRVKQAITKGFIVLPKIK